MNDNSLAGRSKCNSGTIFDNHSKVSFLEYIKLVNEFVYDNVYEISVDSDNGIHRDKSKDDRIKEINIKKLGIRRKKRSHQVINIWRYQGRKKQRKKQSRTIKEVIGIKELVSDSDNL